ncbi:hypothetical protein [Inediibacterium massiliense]|uniref:hypothetical protein n=1 Tax=Inediibacterium massiliense TaxID=1658111 RepID=UPI0006B621D4|nr:hypothetical protein [Inediibacterium massiliense]
MKLISDMNDISVLILINEFIVSVDVRSKEYVPIELMRFLREREMKIEDSQLFDQVCTIIENKLF